jgi:hypothetical protein
MELRVGFLSAKPIKKLLQVFPAGVLSSITPVREDFPIQELSASMAVNGELHHLSQSTFILST